MSHRSKKHRSAAEIAEHQRKQRSSGLSIEAYCRREGICSSSWWYWLKKTGVSDSVPTAVVKPVSFLQLPQLAPSQLVELTLPNGSRICAAPTCDTAFLSRLVGMVSGLRAR